MKFSVVTSMYYSAPFLGEFYARVVKALEDTGENFEIVFVDDGSPDNSLDLAKGFATSDTRVKVIELSRNFGHHNAIMAGLTHTRGELIYLTDCDLEVAPEVFKDFLSAFEGVSIGEIDVVYGYQEKRKGYFFEKISGMLFYSVFNKLCGLNLKKNLIVERLMTRKYVDNLLLIGDFNLYLAGIWEWCGFKQTAVVVKKGLREGASTYTPVKRFQLAVNAITSFSPAPLVILFYLGLMISLLSVLFFLYLSIRKICFPETILVGFPSIMGFMSLSLGLNFSATGLLGIYLAKVFSQTQNRPRFIVRNIFKNSENGEI